MQELNTKYVLEELECISGKWECDKYESEGFIDHQVSRKIIGIFQSEKACDDYEQFLFQEAVKEKAREMYGVFTEKQRKEIEQDDYFRTKFFDKFDTREIVSDF